MQRGVIGGICLLAFLLSVGRGEEPDASKQLEESNVELIKGTEFSTEDVRQSAENTKKLKEISNDLNNTNVSVGIKETNSIAEESKSGLETQPFVGESSTSSETTKNQLSELPAESSNGSQSKEITLPTDTQISLKKSGPYIMDTQFNVQETLPAVRFSDQSDSVGKKLYLAPEIIPSSSPNTEIKSVKEGIQMRTGKNESPFYAGLDILPPLYSAHLASTSNKPVQKDTSASLFSPVFSGDANHYPALGSVAPSDQAANAKTLPAYSYISKAAFEESRHDFKNDDIQARNVAESEYSENMNSYPYSPPSKPDSTPNETNELRSGAPSYPFYQNIGMSSAQAYAGALTDSLSQNNQGSNPYSFGYPPGPGTNSGNMVSANALAQVLSSGTASAQSSVIVIEDAKSRVIWPNELIFPSKIPGGENAIQCTKENEMYHFWSSSFDCLVCVCLNVYGLLEPVCGKCSGCRKSIPTEPPTFTTEQSPAVPDSYIPLPLPESYVPLPIPILEPYSPSASAPSLVVEPIGEQDIQPTTPPPVREVPASCSPLPIDQTYTNPLHPCQICTCKEIVTASGTIDVRIECQDNRECVLPLDVTTLPPIPDIPVPVPLPVCEKFPPHVTFAHPTESCRVCKCLLELSPVGVPEQQITCFHDTECVKKIETTTEPVTPTPPAPPIPIPVEPYAGPIPEPEIELILENIPVPVKPPNAVTSEAPIPWPPISTPAPPPIPFLPKKGPLPGPPPHDSCWPYPPDQPFQHPWDDCQICECSVIKSIGIVNVEITCYTKLSCCIESPEHAISESGVVNNEESQAIQNGPLSNNVKPPLPINTYNPGNIQNQFYDKAKAKPTQNSDLYNQESAQNQGYAAANAISQNSGDLQSQGIAQANAIVLNTAEYNSQGFQNQGYAAANTIAQNPVVSQNQGTAEANSMVYNTGEYNSKDLQNQGYAAANAISQNSGDLQSQGIAQANAIVLNTAEYNSQGFQNQGYAAANTIAQNPVVSQNQVTAEANSIVYNTGDYNSKDLQNQGYAAANAISQNSGDLQSQGIAQANGIVLNTAEYNPQGFQNQGYTAANNIAQNPVVSQNQVTAEANSMVYNTGEYNSKDLQNQGYAAANAIAQNSGPYNSKDLISQGMAEASAIAQKDVNTLSNQLTGPYQSLQGSGQSLAEANAAYGVQGSFKPYKAGISQNQGYAEGNGLSQNSMNNPLYPGSYQSANALGSVNGQTSPEASAEYISLPLISSYNTGVPQNQAYVEDNPGAPTLLSSSAYQPPGSYQSAKAVGSVNSGETGEEYVTVPYKGPLQTQYDPRVPQNPGYLGTIVTNEKFVSTTYKPPLQYDSYNLDITQNKAYSEAVAQYNDRRTNTQKPLLVGQYSPGFTQNQASAQANAQYSSILTSTYKPPALYSQYKPAISQNLVHATPNALYKGTLSITDKPPPLYNPYNSGGSQNNAYPGANAITQNSLPNQGYYLSGQYPSAKAVGSVNGGDQSSAKAEAIAKSQDYSPYYQPGPNVGVNSMSNPTLGFPYQSNYYYQNPQYPSYSSKANTGLNAQYKASPVKYAGNYDFNGQADAISIYSPQSSYNPYSGYSQSLPTSNLYSSLYPNNYNYEITPLYRPGQYGTPNVQSTAEAFAGSKLQVKSGEGYKEDSDESK